MPNAVMHAGAGTAVSCRVCRLPSPLSAAVVAVTKLTGPAHAAPPLPELCRTGLPGIESTAGSVYCAAASHLHPRHQLPFVLSRVAASAALARARHRGSAGAPCPTRDTTAVFTGHRRDAAVQHGCQLSLSHEDTVAAAVACPLPPPLPVSDSTAEASQLGAPACAFAVDVVPVEEVHRVWRRFPHLGERWMPQCVTTATPDAVQRALACMQTAQSPFTTTSGGGPGGDPNPTTTTPPSLHTAAARRAAWWTRFSKPCASPAEAYGALVLAQHWGARECAVKLVGVSGRAFAYGCVRAPVESTTSEAVSTRCLPFTDAFMLPDVFYRAAVEGAEGETMGRHGLQPLLYLYAWTEWVAVSEAADAPHVVVLACAPHVVPFGS